MSSVQQNVIKHKVVCLIWQPSLATSYTCKVMGFNTIGKLRKLRFCAKGNPKGLSRPLPTPTLHTLHLQSWKNLSAGASIFVKALNNLAQLYRATDRIIASKKLEKRAASIQSIRR